MKYTSNTTYSVNITRVSYLHEHTKLYSEFNKSILNAIETNIQDSYDDDLVAIITPHDFSIEYFQKLASIGAGTTAVGVDKQDNRYMYSFAKFKHSRNKKSEVITYEDDIKGFIYDVSNVFKYNLREDKVADFQNVFEKILNYSNTYDQSLHHMMARYAMNYEVASSKGNCGITRNVRNVYTIDCDEKINYDVLVSILTFQKDYAGWDTDPEILNGITRLADFVHRVYELTGALPHIVYNEESSHFQLQYLMKDPVFVTIDPSVMKYKSISAAKRDDSYWKGLNITWQSLFHRSYNQLAVSNKEKDIYDLIDVSFLPTNRIWLVYANNAGADIAELHDIKDLKTKEIDDSRIRKALLDKYVPEVLLGKNIFNLAKDSNVLMTTPEYILYGNAHRSLGYINEGNYKFVDMDYKYCANKSLAIGTDPSTVFNTASDASALSRVQIVYNSISNIFNTQPFNLLDDSAWEYADTYSIPMEFIMFLGSLENARSIFDDDVIDKYNAFCKEHSFIYKKNPTYTSYCKDLQYAKEVSNIYKSNLTVNTSDKDIDKAIEDIDYKSIINISYDESNVPDSIDNICRKYLGKSYEECRKHLIRKIEDCAINGRFISRHHFDYISGLSIFHRALKYNDVFREACKKYNAGNFNNSPESAIIGEINSLISYVFDDVVRKCFKGVLPGTSHSDNYVHSFNIFQYIVGLDASKFKVFEHKKKHVDSSISGTYAMVLWSGVTKTEVIPNMFKLLPFYIEKEQMINNTEIKANKSIKPLVKKAWVSLLDKEFNGDWREDQIDPSDLKKMCVSFSHASYDTKNKTYKKGIKHITRRELEESGASYYIKKDKHIVDFCLDTASHFHVKGNPHYNVNKYTSAIEYFIDIVQQLIQTGDWCIDISEDNIMPPIDDDIKLSGLNIKINGEYAVKNRDLIVSQIKTYRYFTRMYTYIHASLPNIDEYSEEEHIIRLQHAVHELDDLLKEFLKDLYDVLSSYNNYDELECVKDLKDYREGNIHIDIEQAIADMKYKIEVYYNTLELFADYDESIIDDTNGEILLE